MSKKIDLTFSDDHLFFSLRFEEELNIQNIPYRLRFKNDLTYIFNDMNDYIKATQIYSKLSGEFKYDININNLEEKLSLKNQKYYTEYENGVQKILCKEIYERCHINQELIDVIDNKGIFITSVQDVGYKDFKKGYKGLHDKIDKKLHETKREIINSDDYKIKKINLLNKIFKQYNIKI
jgi:hypothetical protein